MGNDFLFYIKTRIDTNYFAFDNQNDNHNIYQANLLF